MMISRVKPLHDKVEQTISAIDHAEHKMSQLENKRKALEARLLDLERGFEEATIDKNEQDEKTVKMEHNLNTAIRLKKVGIYYTYKSSIISFLYLAGLAA
jgi:dynein heavy chain